MQAAFRQAMFVLATAVMTVIAVGPLHLAADNFWQPLNGPTGGSLYALAIDPVSGAIYAATSYQHGYNKNAGSVFKSTDNGDSWTFVSSDFFANGNPINTRVRGLAVNSVGHVFAGLEGGGVWRSINGGGNWSALNSGLGDLRVRGLSISSADEVYAATESAGVFRLNGSIWVGDSASLTNLTTRCFAFGTGYMLVGTGGGGVFKRLTGGNWSAASAGLSDLIINSLYVSPNGGRLLACTNTQLYESTDGAGSWHALGGPFSGNLTWSATEIDGAILLGTNTGLYLSDISGTQWAPANNGYSGTVCRVLIQDDTGQLFAGSFDNGLFRSTDGSLSWSAINDGLYGRTVTRLLVTSSGLMVAGTNQHGMFRSDVLGAAWTGPILPTRNMFALAESPWGDLFAGNYTILPGGIPDGHAWRSVDGGLNWSPLDNGPAVAMVSGFVFPGQNQVICSTAWGINSVRTSSTNGDQWSLLSPGPGNEAYCLTRNNQGDLFIGSEGHGVLRYSASTQTWANLGLATLSQQFSIAINSQGHVFVGNDGNIKGVYKSTANGDGLAPLNSFPSNFGYAILCLPNDDLYVGTLDRGIQYSSNGGATWTTVNSGIPVSSCQSLALGPDGFLYAGVAGFGVYRSSLPAISRIAGDIDGDNDADFADMNLFVNVLLGSETMPIRVLRCDLNFDGSTNGADLNLLISALLNS